MAVALRRLVVGKPLPTSRAVHERLDRWIALPVFASDAVSSSAYATEEILLALMLVGTTVLAASLWVAAAITLLLVIVTFSYRQTVLAYPTGGGAYIVGRENIGPGAAMVAAAALLIDYVLTVAVSVAAGIAAITSAVPSLHTHTVPLCIVAIALIAVGNLRGVRESGMIFAFPTYAFILSMFATLVWGGIQAFTGAGPAPRPDAYTLAPSAAVGQVGLFLLLRAFASGCAALTGIEAISNGVQAFKAPEGRNASITMARMSTILVTLFVGITLLALHFHIVPYTGTGEPETVVSRVAAAVWGGKKGFYFVVQITTMLILVLAANTSFADFPRLAAILGRDRLLPRQFANVGDRLVFNNGILVLAGVSAALIVAFKGSVHGLLPLYAVGVFLSFTISQSGMVLRWFRLRVPGWRASAAVNLAGAITTGTVLIVLLVSKFMPPDGEVFFRLPFTLPLIGGSIRAGAWMVAVLIPILVVGFHRVHSHYQTLRGQLTLEGWDRPRSTQHTVLVLVSGVHRGVVQALDFARLIGADCRALYVEVEHETTLQLYDRWEKWADGVPLIIMESPYRSLTDPVLRYIDAVQEGDPNHVVTVIVPEFVPAKWWHHFLHNQSALLLKLSLLFRRNVIVTNVRYYLQK